MVMMPDSEINIEFDEESGNFYIVWRPFAAVGMGKTAGEALEDVRPAAHHGIETAVDMKLSEIR
jgi:hypothetical protein